MWIPSWKIDPHSEAFFFSCILENRLPNYFIWINASSRVKTVFESFLLKISYSPWYISMIFQIEQLGNIYLLKKGHCEQSIGFTMDCSTLACVGFIFFFLPVFSRWLSLIGPYHIFPLSKKGDELNSDN